MSLISSLVLGSPGVFPIGSVNVTFENENRRFYDIFGASAPNLSPLSRSVRQAASNLFFHPQFQRATQGYMCTFVHEMSHAMTFVAFTDEYAAVSVRPNGTGTTYYPEVDIELSPWQSSVISTAGPMGSVAFGSCQLVAAAALRNTALWPVSVCLGVSATVNISGQLVYATISATARDNGDFGQIRRNGHLAVAGTALVALTTLGGAAAYLTYRLT